MTDKQMMHKNQLASITAFWGWDESTLFQCRFKSSRCQRRWAAFHRRAVKRGLFQ